MPSFESFFLSIGLCIYSLNCLSIFFQVSSNVRLPTERRLKKIFSRSFLLVTCLNIIVGVVSYLSLGQYTDEVDLIIYRK